MQPVRALPPVWPLVPETPVLPRRLSPPRQIPWHKPASRRLRARCRWPLSRVCCDPRPAHGIGQMAIDTLRVARVPQRRQDRRPPRCSCCQCTAWRESPDGLMSWLPQWMMPALPKRKKRRVANAHGVRLDAHAQLMSGRGGGDTGSGKNEVCDISGVAAKSCDGVKGFSSGTAGSISEIARWQRTQCVQVPEGAESIAAVW